MSNFSYCDDKQDKQSARQEVESSSTTPQVSIIAVVYNSNWFPRHKIVYFLFWQWRYRLHLCGVWFGLVWFFYFYCCRIEYRAPIHKVLHFSFFLSLKRADCSEKKKKTSLWLCARNVYVYTSPWKGRHGHVFSITSFFFFFIRKKKGSYLLTWWIERLK